MSAVKKFLKKSGGDAVEISAELAELVRRLEKVKARTGKRVALSPFVAELLARAGKQTAAEGRLHPVRA